MLYPMPGKSHRGPLPPLTQAQRELATQLRRDVETLALEAAPRNIYHPDRLAVTTAFLESALMKAGLTPRRQAFDCEGVEVFNIEAELPGDATSDEIVIVGAHYDTVDDQPGADDNASAVAGLLAIGRALAGRRFHRAVRLVFFVNEEPPFFRTPWMGSVVYVERCKSRREKVAAMLCLEMIGYYTDAPGSQDYPLPAPVKLMLPSRGDFIAFVGNWASRALTARVTGLFREHAAFPSEGGAVPDMVPELGFSDHWAFWQAGYPAVMVTDTAHFRNPNYHTTDDLPDTLDFERAARVVEGLARVVERLAEEGV